MLYLLFVCSLADLLVFSISKDHERSSLTLVRIRGEWKDFRGTQPFQRERSGYHSFLENYEGGDYRQLSVNAGGSLELYRAFRGRNQVNFIMTQLKSSCPPIPPGDKYWSVS